MSFKYIICCDFDGVIHGYQSGWKGATTITDPPVPGAVEWLIKVGCDDRFQLCIYSSRSKEVGGVEAMKAWLRQHLIEFGSRPGTGGHLMTHEEWVIDCDRFLDERLSFPTQKPAASMTIDDRAFHFQGAFPTKEWLLAFKPWTKRPERFRPTAERIEEIRTALLESPEIEWDSHDNAINELLLEIDYLKGLR